MVEYILTFIVAWLAVPAIFYALVGILFTAVIFAMETTNEHDNGIGFWATVESIGIVALMLNHFGVTIHGIRDNLLVAGLGLGGYFAVGIAWSFIKWYFHLSNVRDAYLTLKQAFIEKNGVTAEYLSTPSPIAPQKPDNDAPTLVRQKYREDREQWEKQVMKLESFFTAIARGLRNYKSFSADELHADPSKIVDVIKPQAVKHKAAICEWIAFWPISFIWTAFNDPIRKIVSYIFSRIKGTFQKMSDSMFSKV